MSGYRPTLKHNPLGPLSLSPSLSTLSSFRFYWYFLPSHIVAYTHTHNQTKSICRYTTGNELQIKNTATTNAPGWAPRSTSSGLLELTSSGSIPDHCTLTAVQVFPCRVEYKCILQSLPSYPYAALPVELGSKSRRTWEALLVLLTPDRTLCASGWAWHKPSLGPGLQLSSALCSTEHNMLAPNSAAAFRLNQYLQSSTNHTDAGSGLRVATVLGSSAPLVTGTQHRYTQTSTGCVGQDLTLRYYWARKQPDHIQAHTLCCMFQTLTGSWWTNQTSLHHTLLLTTASTGLLSPAPLARFAAAPSYRIQLSRLSWVSVQLLEKTHDRKLRCDSMRDWAWDIKASQDQSSQA